MDRLSQGDLMPYVHIEETNGMYNVSTVFNKDKNFPYFLRIDEYTGSDPNNPDSDGGKKRVVIINVSKTRGAVLDEVHEVKFSIDKNQIGNENRVHIFIHHLNIHHGGDASIHYPPG